MSNHDVKCKYCGEVTGINHDVCQVCAETAKEMGVDIETLEPVSPQPETDDIPF